MMYKSIPCREECPKSLPAYRTLTQARYLSQYDGCSRLKLSLMVLKHLGVDGTEYLTRGVLQHSTGIPPSWCYALQEHSQMWDLAFAEPLGTSLGKGVDVLKTICVAQNFCE